MEAKEYQNIFKKHAKEKIGLLKKVFSDLKKNKSKSLIRKLREEIHSFKGTASVVDYFEVSDLCRKIEKEIQDFEDKNKNIEEEVLINNLGNNLDKLYQLIEK